MGKAAGLWRAIWASSPDDWAAWQACLRCALAACKPSAAANGLNGREGGAAAGRDSAECPAAQVRIHMLAAHCCCNEWNCVM